MYCYDCPSEDRTTAVAVCAHCKAGLCRDHVWEDSEEVHQVTGTGRAEHRRSARRLTCSICHAAEHGDGPR